MTLWVLSIIGIDKLNKTKKTKKSSLKIGRKSSLFITFLIFWLTTSQSPDTGNFLLFKQNIYRY